MASPSSPSRSSHASTESPGAMQRALRAVREFFYGMMGYELAQHALEMKASVESLFMLAVFGDLIGVPVLPPYYNLRLLPYVVPHISTWKRRVLREREFTDEHDYDLHGL
ncbi:MAG TPA: hypothetical protein VFI11_01390 [Anaerolineales bacterium]|nr:hypothetical protein [Anaerolineales bacterium]